MFFDWFPFIRPSQAPLCFCLLSPSALDAFIITRYRKHTRSPNMQLYSSACVYFHENVSCLSSAINSNQPLHKLLPRKCFAVCARTITALSQQHVLGVRRKPHICSCRVFIVVIEARSGSNNMQARQTDENALKRHSNKRWLKKQNALLHLRTHRLDSVAKQLDRGDFPPEVLHIQLGNFHQRAFFS